MNATLTFGCDDCWDEEQRQAQAELDAQIRQAHAAAVRTAQEIRAMGAQAVLLDCETTDLDGYAIEIAVTTLDGDVLFESLVSPGVPIAPGAQRKHGLRDEDVAGAPTLVALWPALDAVLRDKTLVGYNASFDLGVLTREAWRLGTGRHDAGEIAPWLRLERWRCAMGLYARYAGWWRKHHGDYSFLPLPGAGHRAAGDCRALARLLRNMAHDLPCFYTDGAPCQVGDEVVLQGQPGLVTYLALEWAREDFPKDPAITVRTEAGEVTDRWSALFPSRGPPRGDKESADDVRLEVAVEQVGARAEGFEQGPGDVSTLRA